MDTERRMVSGLIPQQRKPMDLALAVRHADNVRRHFDLSPRELEALRFLEQAAIEAQA